MRSHLNETQTFERIKSASKASSQLPLKRLFTRYWRTILLTIAIDSGIAVSAFFLITFLSTYLIQFHHVSAQTALMLNSASMILCAGLIVFFGWLADKIKAQYIMLCGALGLMIFSYPLFQMFGQGLWPTVLAELAMVLCFAALFAPLPHLLIGLYHPSVRYSGMSFAHNLAMAIFGGTAPMLATFLIKFSNDLAIPGIYLSATMLVTVIGLVVSLKQTGGSFSCSNS